VAGADLVVICVPVGAYGAVGQAIAPHLRDGAIVTDVGSVKGAVIAALAPHMPAGVHLVPGHPIAGTEHSGPEAGFDSLFEGRWCVLTPPEEQDRRGCRCQASCDSRPVFLLLFFRWLGLGWVV